MNIIDRIRLVRPKLNAELSAKQDVRFAGDALSGINPEGSWNSDRASTFGYLGPNTKNELRKREARKRPDYVSHGAFGTVYSHAPGLVRKEIEGEGLRQVKEELDNQLFLAEAGVGPRVAAYERDQHGGMQSIIMQDLRDNYEPTVEGRPEIIDFWSSPGTEDKYRQLALDHQKQMGMLALKGMNLMDRHSGNLMRHRMTGRPVQLDAGIAQRVTGKEQVQTLIQATTEGFNASGQYDVAEIISEIGNEYLAEGKIKEAWDFTKEAFANLQKIKKPLPSLPPSTFSSLTRAEPDSLSSGLPFSWLDSEDQIGQILSLAMQKAKNFAAFVKPQAAITNIPSENLISF